MKTPFRRTAVAAALALIAGSAIAVPGYVTSTGDMAVMSGAGSCVKTGEWTPELAREPCDPVPHAATPAPVVQAEPAQAAPVTPPPVAEKPEVIEKVALSTDVLFEFNKAELLPGGKQRLAELAEHAKGADVTSVAIVGNADRIGKDEHNQDLSERRAMAVKTFLTEQGVQEDHIQAKGAGSSDPVTGDQCKNMGRENNRNQKLIACLQPDRRVDVELLGSRQAAANTGNAAAGGSNAGSSNAGSTTR